MRNTKQNTANGFLAMIVGWFLVTGIGCGGTDQSAGVSNQLAYNEAAPAPLSSTVPSDDADQHAFNTEAYDHIDENPFVSAKQDPLSTFSIDVDTASYANVRRFLNQNRLPPAGAVRIEELVNYFNYDYPDPRGDIPFSVNVELAGCPWKTQHQLVRIGLKGRNIEQESRPTSNLVFLLDVSGSMHDANKLPLVKSAMKLLIDGLGENDRVAIVVYAGAAGLVLPSTTADKKLPILSALENLAAGGSTAGGQGIQLAYRTATQNFIKGGTNRVILCTDGDFNIGSTSRSELVDLIEKEAKSGVFLSVLGFGMGNYKDSSMEQLADRGNGNYAYIDTLNEARKVLVEEMSGTLITIAKDVKIQIDFNPSAVNAYRLIGYENRMLEAEDFKDDTKDAGEIGAGHTVTALYEIVPAGTEYSQRDVDPSKYQETAPVSAVAGNGELLTVRLRYKHPENETSQQFEHPVAASPTPFEKATEDFRFAACVAQFGMLLRNSKHKGDANFDRVQQMAEESRGRDKNGYRAEFNQLVLRARELSQQ